MQPTVFELRQYTMRPGRRDDLIDLFDREFVESQEAVGMRLVGQFRDLDRPDRFVWVRGFADMTSRARALADFYGGPVWRRHAAAANATMLDSTDVLLLRPVGADVGLPVAGHRGGPPATSLVSVTLYHRDAPVDAEFVAFVSEQVKPLLRDAGAEPVALLETEPAENTFPALPVRTGEHVLALFTRFDSERNHRAYADAVAPELTRRLARAPEELRLTPTARSLLR